LSALFGLINLRRQVGSGFSTRVALEAFELNLKDGHDYRFISIDPQPRSSMVASANRLMPSASFNLNLSVTSAVTKTFPRLEFLLKKVQDVDYSTFDVLGVDDILFIDSSHLWDLDGDVRDAVLFGAACGALPLAGSLV
jgi:hypothetical protein